MKITLLTVVTSNW